MKRERRENNIELPDTEIPNKINEFEGLTITGDTENFEIDNQISNYDITYGLGDELQNQINQKSNQKIKITAKDKADAILSGTFESTLIDSLSPREKNAYDNLIKISKEKVYSHPDILLTEAAGFVQSFPLRKAFPSAKHSFAACLER